MPLCSLRHPLQPGGFGFRYEHCVMCCDLNVDRAAIAMHCRSCNESVCERCVATYHDVGFAMFLHKEDLCSLREYMDAPESAVNPDTRVYNWHQEFNDTPLGHDHLAKRITDAEEVVADRKAKLAASEARCTVVNVVKGVICSALGCTTAPDEAGFELFLSKVDPDSLRLYQSKPELALYLCRDPWSARLYGLHEEFNNTAGFRKQLAHKIGVAEREVEDLKAKLDASKERALCTLLGGLRLNIT